MIMDARWAIKTTDTIPVEDFSFTAATAQSSRVFDMRAAGLFNGGHECFLHVNRKGTYTKNALTSLNVMISSCDTEGGTYVEDVNKNIPVASIDASADLGKIVMPGKTKRFVKVTFAPTGAPTALTLNARITTD